MPRHWAFGELAVDEGSLVFHDGGTHGVAGHSLVIAADGSGTWARRVDSMRPHGKVGDGRFERIDLSAAEIERLRVLVWEEAERVRVARAAAPPMIPGAPPHWVWVLAVRQGDEVRLLDSAPPAPCAEVERFIRWAQKRVDSFAG